MKTSYFAKLKEIEYPISISVYTPSWYKGREYKALAPKPWFLEAYKDKKITSEEYTQCYYEEVLNELDPHKVVKDLKEIYDSENFTLLCYEKSGDFCHRHLVSDWLRKSGYEIEEK